LRLERSFFIHGKRRQLINPIETQKPSTPSHVAKETTAKPATYLPVVINAGYKTWMSETVRAASKELQFGTWWRLDTTYWRVSWIEATGELYAVERGSGDHFAVLSCLEKKEINVLMRKWFDGDNLRALFQRFAQHPI
jgi:hypothetical protein